MVLCVQQRYEVKDLRISKYDDMPIQFNVEKEIQIIKQQGLISLLNDNKRYKAKAHLNTLLRHQDFIYMVQQSLILILGQRFPSICCNPGILVKNGEEIKRSYIKIFLNIQSNKQLISNIIVFLASIIPYRKITRVIKSNSPFHCRLPIDVCHLIHFVIFGIFVSDAFIKINLQKIFTSIDPPIIEQIQNLESLNQKQRKFLGQTLQEPNPQNMVQQQVLIQVKNNLQKHKIIKKPPPIKKLPQIEPIKGPVHRKFNLHQISSALSDNLLYSKPCIPFSKNSPIKYRMQFVPQKRNQLLSIMDNEKLQIIDKRQFNKQKREVKKDVFYWQKVVDNLRQRVGINNSKQIKTNESQQSSDSDDIGQFKFKQLPKNIQVQSRPNLKPVKWFKQEKMNKKKQIKQMKQMSSIFTKQVVNYKGRDQNRKNTYIQNKIKSKSKRKNKKKTYKKMSKQFQRSSWLKQSRTQQNKISLPAIK